MFISTLRPDFTTGKDPIRIVQEDGKAPGLVWRSGKSRFTGIRFRTVQPVVLSLYRLSYPAQELLHNWDLNFDTTLTL